MCWLCSVWHVDRGDFQFMHSSSRAQHMRLLYREGSHERAPPVFKGYNKLWEDSAQESRMAPLPPACSSLHIYVLYPPSQARPAHFLPVYG